MKKEHKCVQCNKIPLNKDEIGASKKFLGGKKYYCLNCLAEITGFTLEELEARIQELKENGCQYFTN